MNNKDSEKSVWNIHPTLLKLRKESQSNKTVNFLDLNINT